MSRLLRFRLGSSVRGLIAVVVLLASWLGSSAGVAAAAPPGQVSCHLYTGIPVALAAGEPASYKIAGELCATPAELTNGITVQLLIHGATYNHTYWDFGTVDGVSYSYARDLARAGYPTFAIDEVGTAETSPPPPSTDVTLPVVAYVAHEAVQDLLAGQIAGVRFGRVIEVGHSQGSLTSWEEAATYHDVAGLIITGADHSFSSSAANAIATETIPAIDDPAFANSGLDSGYLTNQAGQLRAQLFYNAADSDPNVIAKDEATKDVISATLASAVPAFVYSTVTQQINVPVLEVLGGADQVFCGPEINGATFDCSSGQAIASQEAPFYSAAAQLRACVIPNSGHDTALALNHDLQEADALAWAHDYVGQARAPAVSTRVLPPNCSR